MRYPGKKTNIAPAEGFEPTCAILETAACDRARLCGHRLFPNFEVVD